MTDTSRRIILDKLVEALAEELAGKELGHCERLDYLSREEALYACKRLRGLAPENVQAFVLGDGHNGETAITSDRAIELRNRKGSVLCVIVPADNRDPAASSLGNAFKPFDVQGFLRDLADRLRRDLDPDFATVVRVVREQFRGRSRPSTEHEVEFLDTVSRCASVDEIGRHLWMVGLVPDLGATERMVERLPQNRECVNRLARPARPQMSVTERVASLGLPPGEVRDGLVEALSGRPLNDVRGWLRALAEEHPGRLTFEQWVFPDVEQSNLEAIDLAPFVDEAGVVVNGCGLKQPSGPGTELEAPKDAKLKIKWTTTPKKPENVSHWSVSLVPDPETYDPEEVAGVDLPATDVAPSRRSFTLECTVDDDIEVRKVQVRVAALDAHGREIVGQDKSVIEAFSVPFWLSEEVGGGDGDGPRRKSTEASLAMVKLRHALKLPKGERDISIAWLPEEREASRLLHYPVLVNGRHIYRLASTPYLAALERHCLEHPGNLGRYRAVGAVDPLQENEFEAIAAPEDVSATETWRLFLNARERCFRNILRQRIPSRDMEGNESQGYGACGSVTNLELDDDEEHKDLRNGILNYLNRYTELLDQVKDAVEPDLEQVRLLCSLDTLELEVRRADETVRAVLLLPTHPLKLAWYLAYWDFMADAVQQVLSMSAADRRERVDVALFERLQPHNLPAFACDAQGSAYVNAGGLLFLHSVMVPADTPDPDGALGEVAYMVGLENADQETSTLSAETVAERLRLFSQLHPYLPALRVQAVNPGRGAFVAEALRLYARPQEDDEDSLRRAQPLDLVVHGRASPQSPAPGLDHLLRDLQQDNVSRGASHLLPTVQLARRSLDLAEVRDLPGRDVNVSIATDVFSPELVTVLPQDEAGVSNSAEALLTRWTTTFNLEDSGCRWTRHVRVEEDGTRGDLLSRRLLAGHDLHLRAVARLVDPAAEAAALPAVTLQLGPEEKQLLDHLHDQSEWVLTVDRNFGVEFYDYPREPELSRESERYIIDHVPEFTDGLGHRLIVTTSWHEEAADVLRKALDELELTSDDESVTGVLRLVKAISGRLAMRIIGDPNHAREVVGLALVADYLRSSGELDRTVLLPIDPHARLFGARDKDNGPNLRCDLLAVTLTPKTLRAAFMEVKFRTSSEATPPDTLLERMVMQMEHTRDRFMERYFPDRPRPDHALLRSELRSLLGYYLDRAWRHGWIAQREDYDALRNHIRRLETAYPQATPVCAGFLVVPNMPETRTVTHKGHPIRIIGRRSIEEDTQFRTIHGPTPPPEPARKAGEGTAPAPTHTPEPTLPEPRKPVPVPEPDTTTRDDPTSIPPTPLGRSALDDEDVTWTPSLQGSPHVLLVGSTGSGKSTTVQHVLGTLILHRVPFLVLDFHGDLADSLQQSRADSVERIDAASGLPFSPLEPVSSTAGQAPNLQTMSYEVAEVIGFVCGLGEMQRDLVYRALVDCYGAAGLEDGVAYPPMRHLRRRLEELEKEPGAPKNVVARCRQLLDFGLFADVTDGDKFQAMLRQPTCVVLGSLQIEQLQHAAVSFVLRRIYRQMFQWGEQERVRLMVVLDEAHRVAKDPTLPRLLKEGRKFGVGVIVASQEIHDFHEAVVHNAGTKVLFRTNFPESKALAKYVQSQSAKGADFARALEGLGVGRAFVQTQQMPHCVECLMYAP
ncbi:MAG: type IV secretion system DNA-binding domain-containing protein [Armatimonadetes bacterium]|nr:type IV secretion system DNA-binding domain-containing protein [Armatimonadota bacterium]